MIKKRLMPLLDTILGKVSTLSKPQKMFSALLVCQMGFRGRASCTANLTHCLSKKACRRWFPSRFKTGFMKNLMIGS